MAKKKGFNYDNYYPIYYWMSQLTVVQNDSKGEPKRDKEGNIIYAKLSGVAKELYAIIYRYSVGERGYCFMGYDTFVKITGASKSTVIRGLKLLEDNRLIREDALVDKQNSKGFNVIKNTKYYRVERKPLEDLEEALGLDEITNRLEPDYEPEELSEDQNFKKVF